MSSIIAVSVSLLGLSLVLFTLAIFVQMVLSFPAMLSSNSQAYVQQQRKHHHIPRDDEQAESDDDDEEFTRGRTLRRRGGGASRLDQGGALVVGCRGRQQQRL